MKSFLPYLGGKSLLTKRIIPLIPSHHCYCEVFSGAAWVLFAKEESKVEILNDVNAELVTLYRVVKNHLREFVRYMEYMLVAREEFERFKLQDVKTLTDIQRAVRFYFLLKSGYGARIKSPTFSVSVSKPSNLNLMRIEQDLSNAHLRLSRVYIENLPFQKFVRRYDKPDTFFYLDPPYFGYENYYGDGIFDQNDFIILRDLMNEIKGKACLSINDVPEIREWFSDFNINEVQTKYSTGKKSKKAKELLILNYVPTQLK
ncbi:MAG: DNA adenine methylase [Gammaproteobacteria bacterium]|nr:DNA adenine methylase [Gammaproteobacteria bacterium]